MCSRCAAEDRRERRWIRWRRTTLSVEPTTQVRSDQAACNSARCSTGLLAKSTINLTGDYVWKPDSGTNNAPCVNFAYRLGYFSNQLFCKLFNRRFSSVTNCSLSFGVSTTVSSCFIVITTEPCALVPYI